MLNLLLLPFKPIGIALAFVIAVSSIVARAEPASCEQRKAAVREYIEAAVAIPDMDEPTREAMRGVLAPIVEAVCEN